MNDERVRSLYKVARTDDAVCGVHERYNEERMQTVVEIKDSHSTIKYAHVITLYTMGTQNTKEYY